MRKSYRWGMVSAAALVCAQTAWAQELETAEPPQAAAEGQGADIVVTGSRIQRTGYDTPSPVAITDQAAIERNGYNNVTDVLLRSPQFSSAVGTGTGNAAGPYNGQFGVSNVNLRGLGNDRTLVLINAARVGI